MFTNATLCQGKRQAGTFLLQKNCTCRKCKCTDKIYRYIWSFNVFVTLLNQNQSLPIKVNLKSTNINSELNHYIDYMVEGMHAHKRRGMRNIYDTIRFFVQHNFLKCSPNHFSAVFYSISNSENSSCGTKCHKSTARPPARYQPNRLIYLQITNDSFGDSYLELIKT